MNDIPGEINNENGSGNPTPADNASPKQKKKNLLVEVVENFEVIIISVVAVILIFTLGIRVCFVSGDSMNRTLNNNDWVIVSGLGYEPQRGDIIVFHMTHDEYQKLNEPMVKRVIAVEGDWIDIDFDTWTVRIADNKEMENAVTLDEPYRYLDPTKANLGSSLDYPLEIPEGYIFVMGDNRNNSLDSRNGNLIGLVDSRRVLGKVIMRLRPLEPIEYKNGG